MSREDFDRLLKRKLEEKEANGSFNEQQLKEWYEYLERLYVQILSYVNPYTQRKVMRVDYQPIEINEEFSGPYEMRSMILHFGTSVVKFEPIGTMLIGSKGRVDVRGPRGIARLGLVNRNIEDARQMIRVRITLPGQEPPPPHEPKSDPEKISWAWKIITPAPAMKFIDLTEDTFFDMLVGVADA